jgi:2'-5' RNA ligase
MNMLTKIIEIFISIEVPMELRKKAAAIVKELPEETIKPIRSEDMHLKLAYFEHYRPERFNEIKQELATVEFFPFTITLKGVMVLPNQDTPRIISVGMDCEQNNLAEKVNEALEGIGISEFNEFPTRETIANVWNFFDVSKFLKKHKDEEFGSFKVNKFYLMQSYFDLDEQSSSRARDHRSRDLKNPKKYMVMSVFD